MARRRRRERGKPWYRSDKDAWAIVLNGRRIALKGPDGRVIHGRNREQEALQAWHEMMAQANAPQTGDETSVAVVFEMFIQDLSRRAKQDTVDKYVKSMNDFVKYNPGLVCKDIRPKNLYDWWDRHPTWGESMRLMTAKQIHAALNWAAGAQGNIISKNRLKGMVMPQWRSRGADTLISNEQHKQLLESVPEDLRDVLVALRFTGTRPKMVCDVEAQHFDEKNGVWRLMKHKTYHRKGKPLIVPLAPQLVDLCKKLAAKYPEGPLFRTAKGEAWNPAKLSARVYWYKKKLGLDHVIAYGYRHTVTTELLEAGTPDALVASICGHEGTDMIYKHYSHLGSRIKPLRDILTEKVAANLDENGVAKEPNVSR